MIIFSTILLSSLKAQNVIKGIVIDKITREPLELAVINNGNNSRNTLTNKEGKFILKTVSKKWFNPYRFFYWI